MNPSLIPFSSLALLCTSLLLSKFLTKCLCSDERYSDCVPFSCGDINNIKYPFWNNDLPEYCGRPDFMISCDDGNVTLEIGDLKYRAIDIDLQDQILRIARTDFLFSICPSQFFNTSMDSTPFRYTPWNKNSSLFYNCQPLESLHSSNNFTCPIDNVDHHGYFIAPLEAGTPFSGLSCTISVVVPVLESSLNGFFSHFLTIPQVLNEGFEVSWSIDENECIDCEKSGGRCGYNRTVNGFTCFCPDQAYATVCPASAPSAKTGSDKVNVKVKVIIGVSAAFAGGLIVCAGCFLYLRHKKKRYATPSSYVSKSHTSYSSKSDIEMGSNYYGVPLFSYEELEEATKNFDSANELGDGGFGTVYYGKLRDKREVAVKRLYENNYKRVEQFMNEVEILTRLRHQNLVTLYGCTSRHCRELLLVYEYISNGTVADHLHGDRKRSCGLPWSTRMKIAVETACALSYLHISDIIHRDIKTNNILLDQNFVVKVADFGLSRLFPMDVTHVSTAPQGTPGYVDPEYHECYQLTDKSDVYSFGVVLIELISSLPAVDITRHRHEINLSNMAINKIQSDRLHELVDPNLEYGSDYNVRKMINAVAELAFQCLQSAKDLRPSMVEVLAILKGISDEDNNPRKSMDMADDVVLLKNGPPPLSPDSVTTKWTSSSDSITPSTSG